MASTEVWLVQVTTGAHKHTQSSWGRTTLISTLRTRVERLCDGEDVPQSPDGRQDEDYDPMAEVDPDGDSPPDRTRVDGVRGVKRTRYYKNHCKNTVVTVSVPVRCPEPDPDCRAMRSVKLFIEDRKTVLLHVDDVAWAIQYLYVQNMLKGVPMVHPDSAGPGGA